MALLVFVFVSSFRISLHQITIQWCSHSGDHWLSTPPSGLTYLMQCIILFSLISALMFSSLDAYYHKVNTSIRFLLEIKPNMYYGWIWMLTKFYRQKTARSIPGCQSTQTRSVGDINYTTCMAKFYTSTQWYRMSCWNMSLHTPCSVLRQTVIATVSCL